MILIFNDYTGCAYIFLSGERGPFPDGWAGPVSLLRAAVLGNHAVLTPGGGLAISPQPFCG